MKSNHWQTLLCHHLPALLPSLGPQQRKVLNQIKECRSEKRGRDVYQCDGCGHQTEQLRACRDRHCPSCQHSATLKWCEARRDDVLPVTYFHLVFTLPSLFNRWVSYHPSIIYRLLFESSWKTLSKFGAQRSRLNGQLGMLSVLHTWGQTLVRHVHLHCLVPGGALSQHNQWKESHKHYLFPVKALSKVFRGFMVSGLREAQMKGLLSKLSDKDIVGTLAQLMSQNWVVYSKAAVYGHDKLIDYLGRYTRKIALTPSRLNSVGNNQVDLRYRDYRDGEKKVMRLSCEELLRRFALHILPKGFMRVRYYGYLSNAIRRKRLATIRHQLKRRQVKVRAQKTLENNETLKSAPYCPACGESHWHYIGVFHRVYWESG